MERLVNNAFTKKLGSWALNASDHQVHINQHHVSALESWLTRSWLPLANNHVRSTSNPRRHLSEKLGAPSLFVRVDWVPNEDPLAGVCEVEDVIGGFGVFSTFSPAGLDRIVETMHKAAVFRLPMIFSHADGYRADLELFSTELTRRGIPSRLHEIADIPRLGLEGQPVFYFVSDDRSGEIPPELRAQGIHPAGADRLPKTLLAVANPAFNRIVQSKEFSSDMASRNGGVVLKDVFGRCASGIVIMPGEHHPSTIKRHKDSKTRLATFLEGSESFLMQDFCCPPHFMAGDKRYFLLKRLWFGFCADTKRFRYLGGIWTARPSLKIHGASDSISGVVTENGDGIRLLT